MLPLELSRFYYIGHRGMEIGSVENTLTAFQRAIDLGVDFLEMDVQETKDHQLIIFHDNFLNSKTTLKGRVKTHTWADIQATTITTSQGSDKIPLLKSVFQLIKPYSSGIIIEIKNKFEINSLLGLINEFNLAPRVIIDSFQFNWIKYIRGNPASIAKSLLVPRLNLSRFLHKFWINWMVNRLQKHHFQGISLHQSNCTSTLIDSFHRYHLLVFAWGVHQTEKYKTLYESGINGFTAPDPAKLLSLIPKRN